MRRHRLPVLLLALALAAAACVSSQSVLRTGLRLGPGGRAEGRIPFAGADSVRIDLRSAGPGPLDYEARTPSGRLLASGRLESVILVPDEAALAEGSVLLVLEAGAGEEASVAFVLSGRGGAGFEWDLKDAFRTTR